MCAAHGKEQGPLAEAVASETSTLTKGGLHEQVARRAGTGRQITVAAEELMSAIRVCCILDVTEIAPPDEHKLSGR